MRVNSLTFVCVAALSLPAAAFAGDQSCCKESGSHACCNKDSAMPAHHHDVSLEGIDVLLTFGSGMTTPEQMFPAQARQRVVVWFHRPVSVGRNVLMGKYIIEHDTDRQARGEPCTFIYAVDHPNTPVVAFHCTHLEAESSDGGMVVLGPAVDGIQKLLRFQFAGEDAAHGYPTR